jgi:hypothetical protein
MAGGFDSGLKSGRPGGVGFFGLSAISRDMASRRSMLAALGCVATAGCTDSLPEDIPLSSGPPPTENKIGEVTRQSLIMKIEFYESGAAKLHPTAERGCYDSMAFRHSATVLSYSDSGLDTSDALATWPFGDFDEVLTVDMLGAMDAKSNYPSRVFVLQFYLEDGVCFTSGGGLQFRVPGEWVSE